MPDSPQHPSALSGVFGQPFAEQVAFFRRKLGNLIPTARWDDIERSAHDSAFMVAGAAKADLLTDLAVAVDKAISEGRGIDTFRKDFRDIVRRNGWTGWAGEGSVKGEAWRVKVIYQTNSYTSYAAGRLAQLKAGNFPFWVYRHGGSLEPRPMHLSWNGLVLPPNHPFWATHYPPSDWGCSCYVVGARSLAGARRLGGDPDKRLAKDWNRIDPKTGAPIGVGKGWNYAPGASAADAVNALARKIGSWDYQVAKAFMGELAPDAAAAFGKAYRALPSSADDARRYAQRVYDPKPDLPPPSPQRTLGLLDPDQAEQIERAIATKVRGYDFSIDQSSIAHIIKNHADDRAQRKQGQRGVTADDFALLPAILNSADRLQFPETRSSLGEALVMFSKDIRGETFVAAFAIGGARRKTLSLKTFYIKLGKK
ncbi:MAG: phage minor head protein [Novosphingobium sp.]|uniref:PBECR3 domain-containing polyvalent protein n=1 Tax=Novosphingobium sp. TaxID=1874826 RepID=UPI0032BE361D